MFILKLENENYYLHEGPSGYAYGRSKRKAKSFQTYADAAKFTIAMGLRVAIVQIKEG